MICPGTAVQIACMAAMSRLIGRRLVTEYDCLYVAYRHAMIERMPNGEEYIVAVPPLNQPVPAEWPGSETRTPPAELLWFFHHQLDVKRNEIARDLAVL